MKKLNVVLITLLALIPQIVWGDVITNYGQYSLKDDGDNHTATFTLAFDKAGIIIADHVAYNNTVYTITAIGEEAFKNCKDLLTLDIPSTVTDIHENAFNDAPIAKITVDTNNETYQAIDSVLFTKSSKTLICYPANKKRRNIRLHLMSMAFSKMLLRTVSTCRPCISQTNSSVRPLLIFQPLKRTQTLN